MLMVHELFVLKKQPDINSKDLITRMHRHTHEMRVSYKFFGAVCLV